MFPGFVTFVRQGNVHVTWSFLSLDKREGEREEEFNDRD